MIIMIEGPDGTGKTTLAKELEKRGLIYHYRYRYNNYTEEEITNMLLDDNVHVLDRGILTPWAYRLVQNQPLDEGDFDFFTVNSFLVSGKMKIIYCNYKFGFDASMKRGENNITNYDTWMNIKSAYDFIMRTIKLFDLCFVCDYNFSHDSIDKVLNFIGEQNAV